MSTLASLRDSVASYIERVGDPDFTSEFPVLVTSLEATINQEIYGLADDGESLADTIPALVNDTDSNWVLTGFWNVYFFGLVMEAGIAGLASEEQAAMATRKFGDALTFLVSARRAKKLKAAKPGGDAP